MLACFATRDLILAANEVFLEDYTTLLPIRSPNDNTPLPMPFLVRPTKRATGKSSGSQGSLCGPPSSFVALFLSGFFRVGGWT